MLLHYIRYGVIFMVLSCFQNTIYCQDTAQHGALPYGNIYAYALDANINPALTLLQNNTSNLTSEDREFKESFISRFGELEDHSHYMEGRKSEIDDLLLMFRDYWRVSLLNPEKKFESALAQKVVPYLMEHYPPIRGREVNRENLGEFLSAYIKSLGLHTIDKVNYQGSLIDLIVWKDQEEQLYDVALDNESIKVKVVLMRDFITLGWNEYATMGAHYPGGWTEPDALYCVKKAYDLNSEDFKVSYLAHEARHFLDKQEFPELSQPDLEYRSKLTELSMARETVYSLVGFFLENANEYAKNAHPIANYWVMRKLSDEIFDSKAVIEDMQAWQEINYRKINRKASLLLRKNTKNLRSIGSDVQSFIN